MGAIKMSGLVSGMDTSAIVEKLVAQSKIPITNLQNKLDLKQLEKDVYKDISSKLGSINTDLLTLRLESTFKTKAAESSNSAVLNATASTEAETGSYSVLVKQAAKNSSWVSSYTRQRIATAGAGVTGSSGIPSDYLEGKHTVTVSNEGSYYLAENSFKPDEWGTLTKYSGFAIDPSVVSSDGTMQNALSGNVTFQVSDSSGSYSSLASVDVDAGDNINEVARDMETSLNNSLNSSKGTTGVQYLTVRADYDKDTEEWSIAVYKPSVYTDMTVSTSDSGIGATLGFNTAGFETSSTTSTIKQYSRAGDLTTLGQKLNNTESGLIKGVTLTGTGLTEGSFSIVQDASLRVASESYSTVTGAANLFADPIGVLSKPLAGAGFATQPTSASNGYFTINDTKVYIDDYSVLTVNDLLSKINSSGAGVTASFDATRNGIVLTSTTSGSTTITVGDSSDTSNLLTVMKLTANQGAVKTTGSTSGAVYPTMALNQANFSSAPTTGTFTINGVSIYVDVTKDTLNDVMKKVNLSGAGVTMSYDTARDKITVVSDGVEPITFGSANDTSTFLESVNLKRGTTTVQTLGTTGQYAILEVNGATYIRDSNEIDDIIAGVTLDVRSANESPVSITVTSDTSKANAALASMVQHYNELMTLLNAPMLDDDQKAYLTALTDEDKESMSDDDIAEYNAYNKEYSKYNIIRKSSELRSLKQSLRSTLFQEIPGLNGSISNLLELGIDIAGDGDLEIEKLGLLVTESVDYDEILAALQSNETLQEVLTDNADDVYEFFMADKVIGNDDDDAEDADGNPINETDDIKGWTRIYASLITRYTDYDGMIQKKIVYNGTLDSEIARIEKQIENYETRAENELERYWKQFTAMEQAIADAQSQGNALTSALGGSE
jgi:flagellar hook-associated protein 2